VKLSVPGDARWWQIIPDTGSETAKRHGETGHRSNRSPCVAERRLRRPVLEATGVHISAR